MQAMSKINGGVRKWQILAGLAGGLMLSCSNGEPQVPEPQKPATWEENLAAAKGSELQFMMWQGDPLINAYISDYVKPQLKELYGIEMNVISGQGNMVVNAIMAEMEAGRESSEIDMMWINGETFYQLRQIVGLYGPFTAELPNASLIDWENPFIAFDFQQPVEGYECPWGNVQLALICDTTRTPEIPQTIEALEAYIRANPGKFTIGTEFTGMTFLKGLLCALAGDRGAMDGPFEEEKYLRLSEPMWNWLERNKPYFWKKGKTFPSTVAQMHALFSSGELHFTMSNNDAEVGNKILQGTLPSSSRAWVPQEGSIRNSHYLGISAKSPHVPAAMVAINFMISPEAQWKKMDPAVWGDGTVLSLNKLDSAWQRAFGEVPGSGSGPGRAEIEARAIMEPAPQYMIRLFEDFRTRIVEGD